MICLWRTHSSPSAITKPFPNIDFLSFLNTDGFPQCFAFTSFDNIFTNSGSAIYKNGSVPNQYVNTFPAITYTIHRQSTLKFQLKYSIAPLLIMIIHPWSNRIFLYKKILKTIHRHERINSADINFCVCMKSNYSIKKMLKTLVKSKDLKREIKIKSMKKNESYNNVVSLIYKNAYRT